MNNLFNRPSGPDAAAIRQLGEDTRRFAAVTRGADGCVVVEGATRIAVAATPVARLLDTTGAGDLFASGLLRGYTAGLPHAESAALGTVAASHIIEQIGPRPQQPLRKLPAVKAILDRVA